MIGIILNSNLVFYIMHFPEELKNIQMLQISDIKNLIAIINVPFTGSIFF